MEKNLFINSKTLAKQMGNCGNSEFMGTLQDQRCQEAPLFLFPLYLENMIGAQSKSSSNLQGYHSAPWATLASVCTSPSQVDHQAATGAMVLRPPHSVLTPDLTIPKPCVLRIPGRCPPSSSQPVCQDTRGASCAWFGTSQPAKETQPVQPTEKLILYKANPSRLGEVAFCLIHKTKSKRKNEETKKSVPNERQKNT